MRCMRYGSIEDASLRCPIGRVEETQGSQVDTSTSLWNTTLSVKRNLLAFEDCVI
jgi:hypothetical protein